MIRAYVSRLEGMHVTLYISNSRNITICALFESSFTLSKECQRRIMKYTWNECIGTSGMRASDSDC